MLVFFVYRSRLYKIIIASNFCEAQNCDLDLQTLRKSDIQTWDCSSVVKHVSSTLKAVDLISSMTKKEKKRKQENKPLHSSKIIDHLQSIGPLFKLRNTKLKRQPGNLSIKLRI
jgi:hypothetical protein